MLNPFFYEKTCAYGECGRTFRTRIKRQRYCCDTCWFRAKAARQRAPRYPRWTTEEIAQLRQLAGQVGVAEIASRIGRTREAVKTRARTLKISLLLHGEKHPAAKYSDYQVELARRMYDEGLKPRAISRVLDMPESTIGSFVRYQHRLGPCPERR